jgi:hypothetical protein
VIDEGIQSDERGTLLAGLAMQLIYYFLGVTVYVMRVPGTSRFDSRGVGCGAARLYFLCLIVLSALV